MAKPDERTERLRPERRDEPTAEPVKEPVLRAAAGPVRTATIEVQKAEMKSPRYAIVGSIHRGGMGEILLAKVEGAEGFVRKVVLKGLLSQLSEDDVSYRLFMREACLMARLDHPNIVRVFDLPFVSGKPYLAMEYLRGRNFHQVIQRSAQKGGMPIRLALHVVAEALRGLHYAHNARDDRGKLLGTIHRDVSPGNILVSFFGEVKVTDFGIATIANAPRFTGPRSIRGKARYVAPEQVHGEQATVLSDLYSAGVVLAEAILGEPLWERATVPETLLAIVSEDRELTIDRVLERRPQVAGLRAALRGGLALEPRDRFPTALQFAETLEAIERSLGGPATHVELGMYLRQLFADAPDLPADDGFGTTGLPMPDFSHGDEPKTDPTIVSLEADWLKPAREETASMRPLAPSAEAFKPLPPLTPVLSSQERAFFPGAMDPANAAARAPSFDRAKPRATSFALPPPTPSFERARSKSQELDAPLVMRVADTEDDGPVSPIRATPLPAAAAIVPLPAHAPAFTEDSLSFSELMPPSPTLEEPSRELSIELPEVLVLDRQGRIASQPKSSLALRSPEGTKLLLAGIFIGAGLAIAGCLLALWVAR
ncbi:protein kinase [Myxococcota bacterium]|nr:protein kinase [Myxococcota bacterium]